MLDFSRVQNYYIACGYTDMRKQIDGLAELGLHQCGQTVDLLAHVRITAGDVVVLYPAEIKHG